MTKDEIVRKLTSRKLWASVASFVSMLMLAIGSTEGSATQVASLIMAGASVIGYVLAEGLTDAANSGSQTDDTDTGRVAGSDGLKH